MDIQKCTGNILVRWVLVLFYKIVELFNAGVSYFYKQFFQVTYDKNTIHNQS